MVTHLPMILRSLLCSLLAMAAVSLLGLEPGPNTRDWDSVTIAPVKTSIYVGSVKLITSEFTRSGDTYTATYEANVFPWFFWNETGSISIHLTAEDLAKLARGERTEFTGEAVNHKRKPRHITGYAERADAATGKIKVRIGVDDTELIFNSTYRFTHVMN